ncbi:MAG: hypothetical protein QGF53_06405 [Alphaproteobacteria bacterium]|jgi:hypothetical protein|nr:hypothetical protein [Alphaproteobacteria bacterium]
MLAVLAIGIAAYGILVVFTGRRSTFTTAIYFLANMLFAYLVYSVLDSSGMSALLTREHTDQSQAALTELCQTSCERNTRIRHLCDEFCGCVMLYARDQLTYPELVAVMTERGDDRSTRLWNQTNRNCAIRVVDRPR